MQRQNFARLIRFSRVLWLSLLVVMLGGPLKPEAAVQTVSLGAKNLPGWQVSPSGVERFGKESALPSVAAADILSLTLNPNVYTVTAGNTVTLRGFFTAPSGTFAYSQEFLFGLTSASPHLTLVAGTITSSNDFNPPIGGAYFEDQIGGGGYLGPTSITGPTVTAVSNLRTFRVPANTPPGTYRYSYGVVYVPIPSGGELFDTSLTIIVTGGCQTNVTRLSQLDPQWAGNFYDHSTTLTIGQKGCALTSLSMALNFAGMSTNPGSLNQLMNSHPADYNGLSVNWDPATRDASGSALLKFFPARLRGQSAMQYLDTQVCQQGHPVIVGVELDASGVPGHFVVVTGKSGSDFQIADPGHSSRTKLSDYGNHFETRGFVADPPGDISSLNVGISDAADFLVIDPAGHRNGVDPATGQVVEEILNSAYFQDGLIDDLTGDSPTEVARTSIIGQPISGTYQLSVIGTKIGSYTLSVRGFSQDGSPQPAVAVSGMTRPGLKSTYLIVYSSTPDAAVRVFDTILQDGSNGITFNFNSMSGDYQFTQCSDGFTLNGRGQVIKRGCGIFLQDFSAPDRRVVAQIDNCQNKGNATIQVFAMGRTFTVVDRDTTNNTGTCQ